VAIDLPLQAREQPRADFASIPAATRQESDEESFDGIAV